ncbi:hypothetical protein MKC66_00645 [[Clostridium] innocuum]|nr:hypothetical protein [[Clostridium] innocuum]
MKQLQHELDMLLSQTDADERIIEALKNEKAVFPFSIEGRILAYLISMRTISYDKYIELQNAYTKRNQYLDLFDMAPRTFGETWGEKHILNLFPALKKATKENISSMYPRFDGEFDLWLDGIRIEVKACRANNTSTRGSLASRAYLHSEAKKSSFKYHYQQLKPSCCDVFIWIGVCRDDLIYWVLTDKELLQTGKLGPQHRNENTGIAGAEVFEGQVFMTEEELAPFCVAENEVMNAVKRKGFNNILQ